MATEAQFNFIDGGERNPNNGAYYMNLGFSSAQNLPITTPASPIYPKPFFWLADGETTGSWVPNNGFSSTSVFFGIRCYLNQIANVSSVDLVNAVGATQLKASINPNGSVSIVSGGNVLATSAPALVSQQTVFFLEIEAVIAAANGSCSVYLNGNPSAIVSVSDANTAASPANLPIESFSADVVGSGYFFARDLYCHDGTGAAPFNAPLGNGGSEYLPASANVDVSFTPNGNANNYQNAAQTPPNPAVDFNQSSTVGASDTFSITPLPSDVLAVYGVKAFNYGSKTDTGARALQNAITSSGVTAEGASNYLNETPVVYEDMFVTDPATNAAFTPAAVNALNISYKISA